MKNRFNEPLDELDGYLRIGMAKQALAVAKTLLRRRPVSSWGFVQAVEVVLIQADKLRPWQRLIEAAYRSLNQNGQQQSAIPTLHFYVSIEDWKTAVKFVPKRPAEPSTLLFGIWTFLNLKEVEKARPLHKKCLRLLRSSLDEFSCSCILEAIASYYAQTGEWELAERAWESGQVFPSFAENAWEGLVELHAYRGLLQANIAFETAKKDDFLGGNELMLPHNSAGRRAFVDKRFHRCAKHLARVIPANERWRFGR